jgi:hypothetical protein
MCFPVIGLDRDHMHLDIEHPISEWRQESSMPQMEQAEDLDMPL